MKNFVIPFLCLLLVGCLSSTPVEVGRDTYSITTRQCDICSSADGSAMTNASKFCQSLGKHMLLVNTTSTMDWHGATHATAQFMCLDKDDPRYTSVMMRKDNGVTTIQNQNQ